MGHWMWWQCKSRSSTSMWLTRVPRGRYVFNTCFKWGTWQHIPRNPSLLCSIGDEQLRFWCNHSLIHGIGLWFMNSVCTQLMNAIDVITIGNLKARCGTDGGVWNAAGTLKSTIRVMRSLCSMNWRTDAMWTIQTAKSAALEYIVISGFNEF